MAMEEYFATNRANWDDRARVHARSPEYNLAAYAQDPTRISGVVRFDLPRLGDVAGLRGVHLQCHIGTDTVSLARLGAHMTGVDLSPVSLQVAREFAASAGAAVEFVESNVYDAAAHLGEGGFDLVYTGIGALGWLPSIDRWAATVAALLRPGGQLFIREHHPVLFATDESRTDALVLGYPYFETTEPLVFESDQTYTTTDQPLEATATCEWNHGLGETITALLNHGMRLTMLEEHRCVPWEALPGQMAASREWDGEWELADRTERMPLSFTLAAVKES